MAPLIASLGDISANSYGFFSAPGTNPNAKFYSIATATVDSGGASSITFGAGGTLPQTYTHLQIRAFSGKDNANVPLLRFNGDSTTNYVIHTLRGDGSSASSGAGTGRTSIYFLDGNGDSSAGSFAGYIIDVADYTNVNKNKVTRSLSGYDANGSGRIASNSGLWLSTNSITQIDLIISGGSFAQYTQFALYGVK